MRVFTQQQKQKEAINPAFSSLLSKETRFHQASTSIHKAREKYGDLMSSPTREGLRQASFVVTEACTLEKHVSHFIIDRDRRIDKLSSRRKRGGLIRPSGNFHTTISLSQIKQQDNNSKKANEAKMMKAQLREGRRVVKAEMDWLKKLWQEDRDHRKSINQKRLTFKAWLDESKEKDNFLALDVQNKHYANLLGYGSVPYFFDTERQSQHTQEVIQRALTKPLIIDQMSVCS
jgi:hypothetical protein